MQRQGDGLIVNIGSACSVHAWAGWGVYSAAKAGLLMFTRCLLAKLRPHGVRVTSVLIHGRVRGVLGNVIKCGSGHGAIHCWRCSRNGFVMDNLRIHDNTGKPVVVVNAPATRSGADGPADHAGCFAAIRRWGMACRACYPKPSYVLPMRRRIFRARLAPPTIRPSV
jgi:hypothetical protein